MEGWVKLFRKFTSWEWYSDPNTKAMFIHCLLKANVTAGEWRGVHYEAGEFITSLSTLCSELGLTMRQARTALERLQTTGEVTSRTTDKVTNKKLTKCRIVTVNNWGQYQVNDKQNDKQTTSGTTTKRQANDKQSDNSIRRKEDKEEKNINICAKDCTSKKSVDELFEEAWKLYPRKRGKGQVSDKDKRKLAEIGLDHFKRALDRYKAYVEDSSFLQYQNGSTFFHSGYIDFLDENYAPSGDRKIDKGKSEFDMTKKMPMYKEFDNEPVQEGKQSPFKGSLSQELMRRKQERGA